MIQIVHKIKIFDHRYVTILKRLFWPKQKHWDANELRIPQNTTSLRRLCNGSVPNVLDIEKNTLENQHFSAKNEQKVDPQQLQSGPASFLSNTMEIFPHHRRFPAPYTALVPYAKASNVRITLQRQGAICAHLWVQTFSTRPRQTTQCG